MIFSQKVNAAHWGLALVVASGLMPLIIPDAGLRVEHVAIPLFFIYALVVYGIPPGSRLFGGGLLVTLWLAVFVSALVSPRFDMACVKELVNFSKAPLLMVAFCAVFTATHMDRDKALLWGVRAYAVIMLFNTSIQVYSTQADISEFASNFVETEPGSLWWLCHSANRHTGLVAMPATVGVMASIALIAAFASRRVGGGSVLFFVLAGSSAIAAFLAMSKVYLVAAPIIVLLLFSGNILTIMSMIVAAFVAVGVVGEWNEAAGRWFDGLIDVGFDMDSLTAGRFSTASRGSVAEGFAFVTERNPFIGVGPGQFNALSGLPYDSEYLLCYASSGGVGLGVYLIFNLWMLVLSFLRMKAISTRFEGRCLLCLVMVIAAAAVGVPVLTGNNSVPMITLLISWASLPVVRRNHQIVGRSLK